MRSALALMASAFFLFLFASSVPGRTAESSPEYSIDAIRYGTVRDFPLAGLVMGAPKDEKIDIAMVVWLVRGGGHTILFDSGFHRQRWIDSFHVTDFVKPDDAVRLAGADPAEVTDVIISHAHWDHIGGIDLFPRATIWIQKGDYEYYTGEAWQKGGKHGGIDPEDMMALVKSNLDGHVRMIDGDDIEILPGIRVYTGPRHTYDSQYIRVAGNPTFVLASDNCYLYQNLESHKASATFSPADEPANVAAQSRMVGLAGSPDRVIPGHDALQFQRFKTDANGRVALIK